MPEIRISRREWLTAAACAVGVLTNIAVVLGSFPFFLKPVSAEFGWGRATFSGVLIMAGLSNAVINPFLGRAVDRWGARPIVLPGIVLYAASIMALSRLQAAPVMLYVVFGILGVGVSMCGPVPLSRVVSDTFREHRGLALALTMGSAGVISTAAMAPISRYLILHYGWRQAYLILGIAVFTIAFPVQFFFLREPRRAPTPAFAAREMRSASPQTGDGSSRAALASITFWMLLATTLLTYGAIAGFQAHSFAWMTEAGVSATVATLLLSLMAASGLIGQPLSGLLLDRVQSHRIAIFFWVLELTGLLLMTGWPRTHALPVGAVLMGIGIGGQMPVLPYFVSRYFGMRSFTELFGYIGSCIALGSTIGPLMLGLAYDHFGSYRLALGGCAIALLLASVLIGLLGPYTYSVRQDTEASA